MSTTLLKDGCVLTLGPRTQNHPKADVLIEDGRIAEIGLGLRARGARVVDASDTIVMPGFVNTHRHAWRSLFRNFGDMPDGSAPDPAVYGPHHRPEDVYAATLIGLLGDLVSGTTTVVDWYDCADEDDHMEAVLQAHADAGLRSVFVHSTPAWAVEASAVPPALKALRERAETEADLPVLAYGSPDPENVPAGVAAVWEQARAIGLRIHAHVGRSIEPGRTVAALGRDNLLGPDVTLVHCSHLKTDDLDAIAEHGARVSLTPASEMAGGLGPPPIQQFIDRDIRPGLGVDDERLAPGDIYAQMRAIDSIQHATMFDLKLAGKAGLPTLLTTRDVIKYATIDGAYTAGLGDVCGSLEVGKQADVVVLRTDRPNIAPVNDPIGAVVWGMDTSNVDWVFVAGVPLLAEGRLTADVDRARTLANVARDRVAAAFSGTPKERDI